MFSPIFATCAVPRGVHVRLGIGQQRAGDLVAKRAKTLVARHEVRLAIDLHQNARAGARLNALHDDSFVGFAGGLLGRRRSPFFAENVHSGVQIAVGLSKGLLAIHQAGVGHFT